jgi:hypothetical protein
MLLILNIELVRTVFRIEVGQSVSNNGIPSERQLDSLKIVSSWRAEG